MAIKILTFRNFVLKVPDPESQWIDLETGLSDDDLETHIDDGWTVLGQSSTVFNNEERIHYTIEL